MSKNYRIEFLPLFKEQYDEIIAYKINNGTLEKFTEEFYKKMDEILEFPNSGSNPKYKRLKKLNYKTKLIQDYIVFYRILGDVIEMKFIYNQRRNYLRLIK